LLRVGLRRVRVAGLLTLELRGVGITSTSSMLRRRRRRSSCPRRRAHAWRPSARRRLLSSTPLLRLSEWITPYQKQHSQRTYLKYFKGK